MWYIIKLFNYEKYENNDLIVKIAILICNTCFYNSIRKKEYVTCQKHVVVFFIVESCETRWKVTLWGFGETSPWLVGLEALFYHKYYLIHGWNITKITSLIIFSHFRAYYPLRLQINGWASPNQNHFGRHHPQYKSQDNHKILVCTPPGGKGESVKVAITRTKLLKYGDYNHTLLAEHRFWW